MTGAIARRELMELAIAGLSSTFIVGSSPAFAERAAMPSLAGASSIHDFDFLLGSWRVRHRRLKKRLAGSDDWEEFDGTMKCQSLLGGLVNLNESVSHRGGGTSRGLGLRAFDAKTGAWADWYLSESAPTDIGEPGLGRFENGVGTFLSDETFEGKSVKVRGRFRSISPTDAEWEQAFSTDGGKAWETNWVMRYTRVG